LDQVLVNDPACGEEIAARCGTTYHTEIDANFCRVREVDGHRQVRGGIVFNNFTGESIQIHCAGWDKHWGNRDLIYLAFDYPFNQLGVKRLFAPIPEDNWDAQVFDMKMGFKPVARIAGVYPHNIACVMMCLERADCRLLGVRPRAFKSNLEN
jgi:RimJ/RimL family protein N-acetyltransferase